MKYYEKKNKYFLFIDEYCFIDDSTDFELVFEDDLELYKNFDKGYAIERKDILNYLFLKDLKFYCKKSV